MSNIYKWIVTSMDAYPQYESETNVVFNVSWMCEGNNKGLPAATYGSVRNSTPVAYAAGSTFTPYDQLTNDQVIGWVQDALGKDSINQIYAEIDVQIATKLNPPVVTPPLPWAN